ncbi:hypothetical protein ES692_09970 [Psychroserpens burtonensis]|uniref:Uncharacterized protein n=1 Tax=Psychroserpens burtonensis TaxID=49278 RepID=A0A5C7BDP0_9FLAO|nr:hypothetical protein [Psychroserpens burtonensis]TXE17302.1 hypothetical protein ES692_09970 [Psychroserpens burtonensis]
MGADIIIFIIAILFGIFLYWRESNGNGMYRFVNKLVNSKELQMAADSKKGFIYQQAFLPRLIFVVTVVLIAALIVEFFTPISIFGSYLGISAFASFAAGTLIGTYVANLVLRSGQVLEEQSESLEGKFDNAVEKGKDFIEDLKSRDVKAVEEAKEEIKAEPKSKVEEKSARDRLKDKGLM